MGKLPPVPPFPTGETASGSQDKPTDDNPESKHEPKGKQGRPSNLKDHLLLTQIIRQSPNQNPTMTPKRMRIEPGHIGEKQKEDI